MSEKKIKVGDRVRFIGGSGPWFEHQITNGDEGTVVGKGICNYDVCVSFPIADIVDIEDLEMIEPTDPRTAFLQDLKSVLEKHNASIYPNGCAVDGIGFKVGDEDIYYDMNYGFGDFITPDNIMGCK